jgi:hypothetical protein
MPSTDLQQNFFRRCLQMIGQPVKVLAALWRTMTSRDTRKVTDDEEW